MEFFLIVFINLINYLKCLWSPKLGGIIQQRSEFLQI
jgi:hypothetical protein